MAKLQQSRLTTMNFLKTLSFYLRSAAFLPAAIRLHRCPLFSAGHYLAKNSDVPGLFLGPELHYLRHGMYEGRNPHPLFDTDYYVTQITHFYGMGIDPLSHFLGHGARVLVSPHPCFDVRFYLFGRQNLAGENPLSHYLAHHDEDGADPNPLFFAADFRLPGETLPAEGGLLGDFLAGGGETRQQQTFTIARLAARNRKLDFQCGIDRFSTFQGALFIAGWAFAPGKTPWRISYRTASGGLEHLAWPGLASADLIDRFGSEASANRFELKLLSDLPANHLDLVLVFQFEDGSAGYAYDLGQYGLRERPHRTFVEEVFIPLLQADPRPAKVLEIGSRDRSGFVSRSALVPSWMEYTGADIVPGDNVDVVCDAHQIASIFPAESFDYVFSVNVFEHILMPWQVVLELNQLLKVGGKVMIFTHQTMPLHDTPCDYWRFSDTAWSALFNADTGFAIVTCGMGDPVEIVARKAHPGSYGLSLAPAYLHSMVLAEKIGPARVAWRVSLDDKAQAYPTEMAGTAANFPD